MERKLTFTCQSYGTLLEPIVGYIQSCFGHVVIPPAQKKKRNRGYSFHNFNPISTRFKVLASLLKNELPFEKFFVLTHFFKILLGGQPTFACQ